MRRYRRDLGAALALGWAADPRRCAILMAISAGAAAGPALGAILAKLLLDQLSKPGSHVPTALMLAAAGVAATAAFLLLAHVSSLLNVGLQLRISARVQSCVSDRTNSLLGLRHFENPAYHDRLRLGLEAAESAPMEAAAAVADTCRGLLSLVGLVSVLTVYWPPLAGLLMLAAVPALLAELAVGRRHSAMTEATVAAQRRRSLYQNIQQDPRAAKEIRIYGLGALFRDRMLAAYAQTSAAEWAMARRIAGTRSVLISLNAMVSLGVVMTVVYQIARGRLTLGDLAMFTGAVAAMQAVLADLTTQAHQLIRTLRLFVHYRQLVAGNDDMADGDRAVAMLTHRIALRDVWFRYDDDGPWVLRGVTFDIPCGATVGLVGLNGAGKSTLVKLLSRFYDPQRGAITWDGVDLRHLRASELRHRIGVSHQDFMSYELTAQENIGVGHLPAIDDLPCIRRAAAKAGVDDSLSALPKGYNTLLSRVFFDDEDRTGVILSGGQWQRVAIARSLLRHDADLLILDEPTASLDALAADQIAQTLHRHRRGHTTLIIAHRLSALGDADTIVVLQDGRVVEQGSHGELLAADGPYARLFTLQAKGYQTESSLVRTN